MNFFLYRRQVLGALGAAGALGIPGLVAAQSSVLPLNTPGLDHLDVIVPDVAATAKFWMGVFNTTLHAQPFQGGFRYFILLAPLPDNREVGYLAIGDSRGRGTYIGHFCTSVFDYRRDAEAIGAAMTQAFRASGFGDFPGTIGVGGIFADPDGIEIQFLPAPDTLVTAAIPSDLTPGGQGLVTPLRVDHVLLQVSEMERAVAYYRILYGMESARDTNSGRITFTFANGSRLILEGTSYTYGAAVARIAHFGIRVAAFDRAAVAAGLTALGASMLTTEDEPDVLRFRDPDGITVELITL